MHDAQQHAADELLLAGPLALEMIQGKAELDSFIVASALSAGGRLQDWTAEEAAPLRAALLDAAASWPGLQGFLAEIDESGADVLQADRDLAFGRLLALAALVEAVGFARAGFKWFYVERQIARLNLNPPGWAAFGPAAGETRAALLLPDRHLVEQVLSVLEELGEDEALARRRSP